MTCYNASAIMMTSKYEIEQKYKIDSPIYIRRLLKILGARILNQGFELNEFWDQGRLLRRHKSVLRLRKTDLRSSLAYKSDTLRHRYTKRIEHETAVDYPQTREILRPLNFRCWRRYKKFRETYRLRSALITLDKLPGSRWYLEIEGSPAAIRRIASKLELPPSRQVKKSYLEILFPKDFR